MRDNFQGLLFCVKTVLLLNLKGSSNEKFEVAQIMAKVIKVKYGLPLIKLVVEVNFKHFKILCLKARIFSGQKNV